MAEVRLDTARIHDWASVHRVSAETFGFPDFYGQNMNAWTDGLTYIREGDGLSSFVLGDPEQLIVILPDFEAFTARVPDMSAELLCVSFVHRRSLDGAASRPGADAALRRFTYRLPFTRSPAFSRG